MTYHFNTFQIEDDTVFYSSEFSYAFTNLKCFRPGHVLVCPKRVVKYIDELSWVEQKDLVETVQRVAKAMLEFYHLKPSGVTLTLQDGKGAGQSVPHVHYHVIPMIPTEPTSHSKQYYDLVKSGNFGPVESLKP
ncbi:histidine triad domain protein [Gregarina niphandrodes]|uniref:Histidine triad domain protein n=1 Tax=Gregarina niphandrodes TaxID=110365 RepID=A0A023B2Z9_GRENI|nr:histidine triad domain protein [Gregarina niphandrodes]EZG55222.1 histidine triad domain protein [Gregarina niphandrodes]|eukprot:XP_011131703.1 histidine triad domain protein [Gregarina niphandrodes]